MLDPLAARLEHYLDVVSARQTLVTSNVANADTPGYKTKDLDFQMDPFLRISIVLHFLRQALGTQSTPSNQVLVGLALFLTILIMQPVGMELYEKAWAPLENNQITLSQALDEGAKPMRTFLLRFVVEALDQ